MKRLFFITIALASAFLTITLAQVLTFRDQAFLVNKNVAAASPYNLTSNLVAYWHLDETSGTREDAYTNNYDLTDVNTVGYDTGKITNAASFVRSNDEHLDAGTTNALKFGDSDFSIAAWIKPDTDLTSVSVLGKWDTANYEYLLYLDSASKLAFYGSDNGANINLLVTANTFGALSSGVWYYVVIMHDAANNKAHISVNDTMDSANYSSGIAQLSALFKLVKPDSSSGTTDIMNGLIDECAAWNRMLTTNEISYLYNSGNGRTLW